MILMFHNFSKKSHSLFYSGEKSKELIIWRAKALNFDFFCYSPLQIIDIVFIDNEIFIYNSNRLYSKLGMNNQRVPKIAPIQLISFDGDKSKRRLK